MLSIRLNEIFVLKMNWIQLAKRVVPFNQTTFTDLEKQYLIESLENGKVSGDGPFTKKCHNFFQNFLDVNKVLLTTSATHALEMAAILLEIESGDEVIMPSYTFVSTANAFVLRGAKIVFIDIRPDTMNLDEKKIESAITRRTKAIIPVHYGAFGAEMEKITDSAKKHNLFVIEDAAQGFMANYKNIPLGTMSDLGVFSFHDTKNYTSGEGGLLIINNEHFSERAEIIREKGTNRSKFLRGQVDKYTWVDIGSSYLPSELQAALLCAQLERAEEIKKKRMELWNSYYENLKTLEAERYINLPMKNPEVYDHNGHIFYIKVKDLEERTKLIDHLKQAEIQATFHYVPLHTSPAGLKYGRFFGKDEFTTKESNRLLRLPLYYDLTFNQIDFICKTIHEFYLR